METRSGENHTAPRALPLLIYLLPAVGDLVVALLMFVNAVRLARMGASASVVANSLTVWSVVYLATCVVAGRLVTLANAARLMTRAMTAMALLSLLFTFIPGVSGIYLLMGLAGVATCFFFVPFQVFMKAVDAGHDKPVTYSTGLYTFSWSMGFAAGPFVAGFLMELGTDTRTGLDMGWKYACWFAAVASALCGVGVVLLQHLSRGQQPGRAPDRQGQPGVTDYSRRPDLAWLGWVAGAAGVLVLTFIRAVFPSRAESGLHLSQSLQGIIFFLVSLVQGVTGLALCRSRTWMYRAGLSGIFGVSGMAGILLFGFGRSPLVLCLGAVLFGIYAGGFFFYLVFHALVHPEKSARYVAVNEAVVGLSGMVGAAFGGWLADRFGFGSLYATGAAIILACIVFQGVVSRRSRAS